MSKLKRTPLFGYDGNLGIPIIPKMKQMSLQVRNMLFLDIMYFRLKNLFVTYMPICIIEMYKYYMIRVINLLKHLS